jgi:hypothetical protein
VNAAEVVAELADWREKFEAGGIRLWGLRQPKLEPDERFAVRVIKVGVAERDLNVPMSEWADRTGSTGLAGRPMGAALATSERVFVVGNSPTNIVREWRWRDVASVGLLPVAVGVVIRRDLDLPEADVVASEWNPYVVASRPDPGKLLVRWLKVEAAFAASKGSLDPWFAALPGRVEAGIKG